MINYQNNKVSVYFISLFAFVCVISILVYQRATKQVDDYNAEYEQVALQNYHESVFLVQEKQSTFTVKSGDTLSTILQTLKISSDDIKNSSSQLSKILPNLSLSIGNEVVVTYYNIYDSENGQERAYLTRLNIKISKEKEYEVVRSGDNEFESKSILKELDKIVNISEGVIENSLFVDGSASGIPVNVLLSLIKIYSYDIDFQRDIRKGDRFKIMYEAYVDENGVLVREGKIIAALLEVNNKKYKAYHFKDGNNEFFDAEGNSLQKSLLRTPINGARISSNFGRRVHPILGYSKMHTGIDFAAPTGTPIFASGNGAIEYIGVKGGYGNYIRIQHNQTYSSAYAHMHRFAKGMKKGIKVKQGQVIGYVGTTGRSTGPHLHYEVLKNGVHINPSSIKTTSGTKLSGKKLEEFKKHIKEVDAVFNK